MPETTVNEILRQLEDWGVSDPREGVEGSIYVKPAPPLEIYKIYERDTTPLLLKLYRNALSSIQAAPIIPCPPAIGIRPACRFQTKVVPPNIKYGIGPTELYDVQVNCIPWRLFVRGTVECRQNNTSEEGADCNKRVYEEDWHCVKEAGSADLLTNAINTFIASDANVTFADRLQMGYDKVRPNYSAETSVRWEITGVWDWLVTLINILLTGSCKTRGGIDSAAKYEWKGETHTANKHFDMEVRVPVVGAVEYTWWI